MKKIIKSSVEVTNGPLPNINLVGSDKVFFRTENLVEKIKIKVWSDKEYEADIQESGYSTIKIDKFNTIYAVGGWGSKTGNPIRITSTNPTVRYTANGDGKDYFKVPDDWLINHSYDTRPDIVSENSPILYVYQFDETPSSGTILYPILAIEPPKDNLIKRPLKHIVVSNKGVETIHDVYPDVYGRIPYVFKVPADFDLNDNLSKITMLEDWYYPEDGEEDSSFAAMWLLNEDRPIEYLVNDNEGIGEQFYPHKKYIPSKENPKFYIFNSYTMLGGVEVEVYPACFILDFSDCLK